MSTAELQTPSVQRLHSYGRIDW